MSKLPYKQSVTSHGLSLRLFEICVPEQSNFPDLIRQLLDHSFGLEDRQRCIQEKTLIARRKTCTLFIEGLFQAFCSAVPDTAVAFSNSQSSYKQGQSDKVSHHSFRNVNACYKALVNLGWVTYCREFIDAAGQNHPTTLAPFGELLDRFASTQPFWRRLTLNQQEGGAGGGSAARSATQLREFPGQRRAQPLRGAKTAGPPRSKSDDALRAPVAGGVDRGGEHRGQFGGAAAGGGCKPADGGDGRSVISGRLARTSFSRSTFFSSRRTCSASDLKKNTNHSSQFGASVRIVPCVWRNAR